MRPRYWLLALGFAGLLIAADVVYWQLATTQLRHGFIAWETEQRAKGWDIGTGPVSQGGWPLAARILVQNVTLRHAAGTMPGSVQVAAPAITLSVSLTHPDRPKIEVGSPVHVRVAQMPDLIVTGEAMSASARLSGGAALPFSFEGQRLRLESADGAWHATAAELRISGNYNTPVVGVAHAEPAVEFRLDASAMSLPSVMKWPLGSNVSALTLQGALNGPIPATAEITPWAKAWRNNGGSLQISDFHTTWGPLTVSASATLALDDQLQPMGTGNAHIVGYAETLDRLASGGIMTHSAATAAKAVLSLIAGRGGDDPGAIDVPLTLQYRTLSMRQIPLLRFPELDWPPER
ncbi:MAG TPA: DUF2125 domain-containing protein [Rhodopila sp.]|nr:DUF2125 domain-containing protein [Rhodopila sp.]